MRWSAASSGAAVPAAMKPLRAATSGMRKDTCMAHPFDRWRTLERNWRPVGNGQLSRGMGQIEAARNDMDARRGVHLQLAALLIRQFWLGREDSNLRMAESKSAALPLGYAPP